MRGRDVIAVALRHPDGRIVWADERLAVGFRATRWARLPFMRGLVVLYETLVVGTRWLVRSAGVAAVEELGPSSSAPLAPIAPPGSPPAPPAPTASPPSPASGLATDAAELHVAAGPRPADGGTAPATAVIVSSPPDRASAAGSAGSAVAPLAEARLAVAVAPGPGDATTPSEDATTPSEDAASPDGDAASPTDIVTDAPPPAPPAARVADSADLGKGAIALMLGLTLVFGIGLFFFLPLLLAKAIAGGQSPFVERAVEGVVQVVIFLGYLSLIGRTKDVRRTFQYHGAEHMSIHALEAGDPLTVEHVRRYPTAHPRCGTEFLVVVILVSIVVFSLVGRQEIAVMIGSRIVLIPVIAGISYELLRFGARHRGSRIVRALFQPGIWVQKITTKQPTDDMLEVAIVSLEQALLADGEALPAGAGQIERSPLILSAEARPAAEA